VIESLKPGDIYQEMLTHFVIVLDVSDQCVLCYLSDRKKPLIVSHKGFERHIKYKRYSHNFHTHMYEGGLRAKVCNSVQSLAIGQHETFKRKSAKMELL